MSLKTTHTPVQFHHNIAYKGRGTALNLEGRFENWQRDHIDDGWHNPEYDDSAQSHLPKTIITDEIAKSIISKNDSPDIPFRYSINPYRGCEHGCVYCFARPSHAYLGLSPGLDFETRLFAKTNAEALLRAELSKSSYRCDVIALGVNTDAYQPIERTYQITRRLLEVMLEARQPVALITKSSLIERDIDLLQALAQQNLVHVTISITTLNHEISRFLEPRTSAPKRRLQTIERLANVGIPVGLNVAPVIPFLTDSEMESILETAAAHGAKHAGYILLRLPWELKSLFRDWLETHFPLKAVHVMSRVTAMRGGKENDPRFGSRMSGDGVLAKLLAQRFQKACARFHLNQGGRDGLSKLTLNHFRSPNQTNQGILF